MTIQLTTLVGQIQEWANRQDWSTALAQSYVTMAEQKFNSDLRVSRMLMTATNTVTCRCSTLPDNWLEAFLIFVADDCMASGWRPIRYKANDEFFRLSDWHAYGYYTIVGRTITFGGSPDDVEGVQYQMTYFAEVPILNDVTDSWLYTKYPNLYLWASLSNAALHAIGEEQTAANFDGLANNLITKLNADFLRERASGSRITRRGRSFG